MGGCAPALREGSRAFSPSVTSTTVFFAYWSTACGDGPESIRRFHLGSARRFQTPTSGALEYLRFEKAYRISGSGDAWRVVAEGRVSLASPPGDPLLARAR